MKDYRPPADQRTLKRGDTRADGLYFYGYQRSIKPNGEIWVTQDELERRRVEHRKHSKKSHEKLKRDYRPPEEKRTLSKGDVREDGMIFWSYKPGIKPNGEEWLTQDAYQIREEKGRARWRREDVKKKQREKQRIAYHYKIQTDPEYRKKRNERNRQRDRSEYWSSPEVKERRRELYQKNKEKEKERQKKYYQNLTPEQKAKRNKWFREYRAERKNSDPAFLMMQRLRERMHKALRRANSKKKSHMMDSIGCTPEFLVNYLKVRFKPGMTWDNYGSEWHIDHVRPLADFDLRKKSEQLKANHYTNLQPMWATENLAKSNKILCQQDLIKL